MEKNTATYSGAPAIVDPAADRDFRNIAQSYGIDPQDFWIDKYVDYEWEKIRRILQAYFGDIRGREILEFGCNVGGTAIVLAHLGARVTAIDVEGAYIAIAEQNARRYGRDGDIRFRHVLDTRQLPFDIGGFDMVICNSVLEYVPHEILPPVLAEIDRVVAPGGHVVILGTSNRLWPVEVHERQWLINYIPRRLDRHLGRRAEGFFRGVFPWTLARGFPGYENLDRADGGRRFLASREAMGQSRGQLRIYAALSRMLALFGVTLGQVLWNITLILRKP